VEPLITHRDITTIMELLSGIHDDVKRIRRVLEDDDAEEEEEWEPDA
jgi:hypothetical protein